MLKIIIKKQHVNLIKFLFLFFKWLLESPSVIFFYLQNLYMQVPPAKLWPSGSGWLLPARCKVSFGRTSPSLRIPRRKVMLNCPGLVWSHPVFMTVLCRRLFFNFAADCNSPNCSVPARRSLRGERDHVRVLPHDASTAGVGRDQVEKTS